MLFSNIEPFILRVLLVFITTFIVTVFIANPIIKILDKMQFAQVIREEGPKSHYAKKGTPTMGGLIIVLGIILSSILFSNMGNFNVQLLLFVTISYALIGFYDDYLKVVKKNSKGLSAKKKLFSQFFIAFIVAVFFYLHYGSPALFGIGNAETTLTTLSSFSIYFPIVKNCSLYLGPLFLIFLLIVIVGSSNAVNLTDGLDGLAIMPISLIAAALVLLGYLMSIGYLDGYMPNLTVSDLHEIIVYAAIISGTGLAFLWYNCYPADIFMGDVGSLSLGATLGLLALLLKLELFLPIMGLVFVVETLSVVIQVISYKKTGKRVFRMAPIHHHFELGGWPETKVIVRFWLVTIMMIILSFCLLKLF